MLGRGGILLCPRGFPAVTVRLKLRDGAAKSPCTCGLDSEIYTYSGQCTYCGHCAPCPKGIDIAMVNKLYDLAVMQPQVPESIRAHYQALSAKAEDCIACRNCEQRCPFGVPVIERMEKIKELHLL
mgnify:CR=1 FL=1